MKYQSIGHLYYYNYPKVQLTNTSHASNYYFPSFMNSHVGVASHNDSRYVASANIYVVNDLHYTHHNSAHHVRKPKSTTNSLSFNATSNIRHTYSYSAANHKIYS